MREEVPDCEECTAAEENPPEFMEQEICPTCVWSLDVLEPAIYDLLYWCNLIDSGCPVGRHELRNQDWLLIGALQQERARLAMEKSRRESDNVG